MLSFSKYKNAQIIWAAIAVVALAFGLAWISSGFVNVTGWAAFLLIALIGLGIGVLVWKSIESEAPGSWLLGLIIGAVVLRVAIGTFWFMALPEWGYDTPVQQAGYVMEDAFNRDEAAWKLAQSDLPLVESFRGYSVRDQYGGLLFLSAAIYRFVGAGEHQALLMLVFAATISGLGVAYTWAFSKTLWGEKSAKLAAWGLTLLPEAVLLGSSQMREAFSVSLTMMALYGTIKWRDSRSLFHGALVLIPIALAIPLSTPFALSLVVLVGVVALAAYDWPILRQRKFLVMGAAGILVLLAVYFLSPLSENIWIVQSAEWQAYISKNASGWVARQFERMPLWGQIPFLLIYGIFRPLLPAAIFADGLPIWRAVAIWRALGWTVILALLIYASYMVLRQKALLKIPGVLLASNWGLILISSYRGGGDLWDSPRYRSAFAGMQVALAAWAWVKQGESKDPWLKRAFVSASLMIAWFAPWYLRRYANFDWPIVELQHVIGLGLASTVLYVIWDWAEA